MHIKPKEYFPLVQGKGRYLDDISLSGCLHVAFVRSPHASAHIKDIDIDQAKNMPGIIDIITAKDLLEKIRPIIARLERRDNAEYYPTSWWPLALDRVRYVGEAVVAVVAESRYIAEDAIDSIEIDYEPTASVVKPSIYLAEDHEDSAVPCVHDEVPDNILYRTRVKRSLRENESISNRVSVSGRFVHPRVTGGAMENAGVIAQYLRATEELTLWTSTQVPHLIRDGLSECLQIEAGKIRVIAPDVGGGFGTKMQLLPEEVILAYAARKHETSLKWIQDRAESLQASFHARDIEVQAELIGTDDGEFVAIKARAYCDVGAYSSFPLTCALEPITVLGGLTGPYKIPEVEYEGFALASNKCPQGAYRGVGFPMDPIVLEGLIDRYARKIEMDPMEVRRRNLLTASDFPYAAPTGSIYDSGDYLKLFHIALEQSNHDEWMKRKNEKKNASERLGIGVSCYVEPTGLNRNVFRARGMVHIPGFDSACIQVDPGGRIEASVSIPTQGQAQASAYTTLISRELGVARDSIHIVLGDTARSPYGSGTFNSHGMVTGGGAVLSCLHKLKSRLEAIAANHWGIEPDSVSYTAGGVVDKAGNERKLSFQELSHMANSPLESLPADIEPGLNFISSYDPVTPAVSSAVHVAVVKVDVETGYVKIKDYVVVEDCGEVIDKQSVDGQIRGGIAQGIGVALHEQLTYDQNGQFLSGTLADYLLPAIGDVPEIKIYHEFTPSPHNLGGFKGVGESGIIGAPAAIANAVIDAIGLADRDISLPLTPEKVLNYFKGN